MPKKELKKLKSSVIGRSASLLQLTVKGSAKWAGNRLMDSLSKDPNRMEAFFLDQARVLVKELGQLKGSVMKAGQMLSIYGEHFFPESINEILRDLHSNSSPVVWSEMEKALRKELGEEYDLYDIDQEPFAAASLGQVYRAQREGYPPLALKIQYPGVGDAVDSDLKSLRSILSVSRLLPSSEGVDAIFDEIRTMLKREVDYRRELETVQHYQELLRERDDFAIPEVYDQASTQRLLVMNYEEGEDLASSLVESLDQETRNQIGYAIAWLTMQEIFNWKLVQTDPHFGNYKIRMNDDGKVQMVLLDFGSVRRFPKRYIRPFSRLIQSALDRDREKNCKAAKELGFLGEGDKPASVELMYKICVLAVEPLEVENYDWENSELIAKMTVLAKDAVFSFKLRPPPREAVFLDRKLIGMFMMLRHFKVRLTLRPMLEEAFECI